MREIFWYKRALALTTDGWVELWCNWIGQTFCVQISKDIAISESNWECITASNI